MTKVDVEEMKISYVLVEGNFRRHFDAQKLKELTDSIQEFGVLEPILVRPRGELGGEGQQEDEVCILIAGERRLRAAKAAGLKTIPARILQVDAKAAAEIQLLENLHREDLGPMDEAHAFKVLLDGGNHTVDTLADRVDKSVAYVYRSLKLLELPTDAIEAIQDGRITPAHGHQILRAPVETQGAITHHVLEAVKTRSYPAWELRNYIDYEYSADLAHAIFPKGKPYANEIACTGCPWNTGNQGQLFDGAPKGKCCNTPCFQKKTDLFLEEYSKEQAAEHPGLQYLGQQTVALDGAVEGMKRAVIVPAPTKKLMTANPDKFGWMVVKPRNPGDKPTTAIVCTDRRILEASGNRAPSAANSDSRERPGFPGKERFLEGFVDTAYTKAISATIEARNRFDFTEAQWAILLDHISEDGVVIKGKPDRLLAQQLLVSLVYANDDVKGCMKSLGLNPEQIERLARKDWEAEWAKRPADK